MRKWKYGFLWVTLSFFVISVIGHWLCAWLVYVEDARAHDQEIRISEYLTITGRDTLENWQSEFLQLVWQVAGLAMLLHVGSPQSKEGDDRREEKLDFLLSRAEGGEARRKELDRKYQRG
jgi:hypothetical protein